MISPNRFSRQSNSACTYMPPGAGPELLHCTRMRASAHIRASECFWGGPGHAPRPLQRPTTTVRCQSNKCRLSSLSYRAEFCLYMYTSEQRNSLIEERSTFLPSASLENGVFPEPFSCSSHLSPPGPTTSPR